MTAGSRRPEKKKKAKAEILPEDPSRENRWCEKYGYFIDIEACRSRALSKPHCGRCLCRWRQASFPFLNTT